MNRASGDLNLAKKIKGLSNKVDVELTALAEEIEAELNDIKDQIGICRVNYPLSENRTIYPTDGMFKAVLRGQDLVGTGGLVARCEYIGPIYEEDDPDYEGNTPWRKDYQYSFGADGIGHYLFDCTFEAATEEDAVSGNFECASWSIVL